MPYLEIIMPHYREPWSIGEKFFQMLRMQRGISFDDIGVILVQDGEEGKLPKSIFKGFPFQVKQITIRHQGVSAARNKGIETATAEWVAFCDFDDMYSSALSLKVALEALKKAERDGIVYLWNRFMEEGRDPETGDYMLYKHPWDATFIHGRFIRRQFLIDNGLCFNPSLSFGEDSDFNFLAQILAGQQRIGELKEPMTSDEFAGYVKNALGAPVVEYSDCGKLIKKVAVTGGSASSMICDALACGADALVGGEIKYHDLEDSQDYGLSLFAAGHFFTENPVCARLFELAAEAGATPIITFCNRVKYSV